MNNTIIETTDDKPDDKPSGNFTVLPLSDIDEEQKDIEYFRQLIFRGLGILNDNSTKS